MYSFYHAIEEVRRLVCEGMPLEFAVTQVSEQFKVNEMSLLAAIDSTFE